MWSAFQNVVAVAHHFLKVGVRRKPGAVVLNFILTCWLVEEVMALIAKSRASKTVAAPNAIEAKRTGRTIHAFP
jgi:hypothetical protein